MATARLPTMDSGDGVALADAFEQIERSCGVPIVPDGAALSEADVFPTTPVMYRIRNIPADKMLGILIDMLDNDRPLPLAHWVDEDGSGVVVSVARASPENRPCWEAYGVRSLTRGLRPGANDPGRLDQLESIESLVTQTVDPTSWRKQGGLGVCRVAGDRMYVLQSAAKQREVGQLLVLLKETDLRRLYARLRGQPWPPGR